MLSHWICTITLLLIHLLRMQYGHYLLRHCPKNMNLYPKNQISTFPLGLLSQESQNVLLFCSKVRSSPVEPGEERGGGRPAAGLLALLSLPRGLMRGLPRGVLKLDCRSCSARLARSNASAILCTAPCARSGRSQRQHLSFSCPGSSQE